MSRILYARTLLVVLVCECQTVQYFVRAYNRHNTSARFVPTSIYLVFRIWLTIQEPLPRTCLTQSWYRLEMPVSVRAPDCRGLPTVDVELPELDEFEETRWEYELLGLSPSGQVMRHYRSALQRAGILSTTEVKAQPNGRVVRVGGMAVVKQRPSTAKGVLFVSLEDEFGLLDLVVKPDVYKRFRPLLRHETFPLVEGVVQQASGAISVLVARAMEWPRATSQRAAR